MHLDRGAVAALVHRPAGQSRRRPAGWKPFNYTYHFFWGLEDVIAVFTNMWSQLETNKTVGGLFPNDGDGNAWGDKASASRRCSTRAATSSPIPAATRTSPTISRRRSPPSRSANGEIVTGVVLPPDFTTFWNQALQQGFKPKVASIGKAILFPVAVEALGQGRQQSVVGSLVVAEPSVQVVADGHERQGARRLPIEAATRKQWTQPIGFVHALFEVAVDVLKRAPDRDAKAIVAAIAATNLDTIVGQVQWDGANLPPFAAKNVAKTPLVGGQWRLKDGKYDLVIIDNRTRRRFPVGGKMEPIA